MYDNPTTFNINSQNVRLRFEDYDQFISSEI